MPTYDSTVLFFVSSICGLTSFTVYLHFIGQQRTNIQTNKVERTVLKPKRKKRGEDHFKIITSVVDEQYYVYVCGLIRRKYVHRKEENIW